MRIRSKAIPGFPNYKVTNDGRVIEYPSIYAAAKAIGKHRAIITRMVRKYGVYGKRSCDYLVRRAV